MKTMISIAAVLGLMASAPTAKGADLSGDCCSDLEARVAQLEAYAVRSGNNKIQLELSGSVSYAVLWSNIPGGTGRPDIVNNLQGDNGDIIDLSGSSKIGTSAHAGFFMELQLEPPHPWSTNSEAVMNEAYVWASSDALGKVSLGEIDMATRALERRKARNHRVV